MVKGSPVPKQLSPESTRGKTAVANGSTSAHSYLNGHNKASFRKSTERANEEPEVAAGDGSKALHAHANGHSTAQQAWLSAGSEHTAAQNGALHSLTAVSAGVAAQTQPDTSLAEKKERGTGSRDPAKDVMCDSRSWCKQHLADEELKCSRPPDRWQPEEQAGSRMREAPQTERAHACNHMCLHAHELSHDQEQRCIREQLHERSQQVSHGHRERRREGPGDDSRSRSTSPSASRAEKPSTDPDQPRQGADAIGRAEHPDPVELAEVTMLAPDQTMHAAQRPHTDVPMTGTPDTANPLARNSSLQADPSQRLCPPVGTANNAGSAGDINDLPNSLVSAAEGESGAPPAALLAADAPRASVVPEAGRSRAGASAVEAGPAAHPPSGAAGTQQATSAQPVVATPVGPHAAPLDSIGASDADDIMVPTPDQADAERAASRLMLTGYGSGLDWVCDSLDTIPEEPMLLLDVPCGPRIFATGVSKHV